MSTRAALTAIVLLGLSGLAPAADPPGESTEAPPADALRAEELARMRTNARTITVRQRVEQEERPVELVEPAVLNYSDPGGTTTDGTIWVLGKSGRPAAMAGVFYIRYANGTERWSCELLSLSEHPLEMTGKSGWAWTPQTAELTWHEFAGAPKPAENSRSRGLQMKNLARKFTVTEFLAPDQPEPLRVMDRPLYKYVDEERRVVDGQMFAFATGTNPEAVLLLECRRTDAGGEAWHYAFARMTAAQAEARLDDEVVWTCPPIGPWIKTEAYYSKFGDEAVIFGDEVEPEPVLRGRTIR